MPRYLIALAIALIVILAGSYATLQKKRSEREARLITLFRQGKSLQCQEYRVNQEHFNFVSGTLSFIGKANTPYHGITLSIETCQESSES
ncbi:hypothetical protein [Wolinella succinogenes]|uniref:hypothetical protein n=1 Tax=Wolinella succinogenes TaxID=844 RepID=UPI0024098D64|nr:hypothetical protein [Wolinella succinogenes]